MSRALFRVRTPPLHRTGVRARQVSARVSRTGFRYTGVRAPPWSPWASAPG